MLNALTVLAFVLHIGAGTIALGAGTVAAIASKGGPLHRAAGQVFLVAMLVMAALIMRPRRRTRLGPRRSCIQPITLRSHSVSSATLMISTTVMTMISAVECA